VAYPHPFHASPLAAQLTANFYRWEQRGRGWQVWDYPVNLEPPYEPFVHALLDPGPVIDDGQHPTLLGVLSEYICNLFSPAPVAPARLVAPEPEPDVAAYVEPPDLREISVTLLPNQKITVEHAEQLLLGCGGSVHPLSFEIVGRSDRIEVLFACHHHDAKTVLQQVKACFPDAIVLERPESLAAGWNIRLPAVIVEFGLAAEFMRPIRIVRRFDPDPLAGLIGALDDLAMGELGWLQILFQPVQHPWADDILRSVSDGEGRSFFADCPDMLPLAKEKIARPLYAVVARVIGQAQATNRAWEIVRALGAGFKHWDQPQGNQLIPLKNTGYDEEEHLADALCRQSHRSGLILNSQELLALAHLPSDSVRAMKLVREWRKTSAAPAAGSGSRLILGNNAHQGQNTIVTLSDDQRLKHMYVVGASGTGKSTLLLNMILQDIAAGRGVGLLDPHGDLVKSVLRHIPQHRLDDVILFDAADTEYPFALNILDARDDAERERIVAETIMALERYFPASWGPRLERILQYTLRTVLHAIPDATLADVELMLTDPEHRAAVLAKTTDPRMLQFWNTQFKFFPKNATDPVLNKLSVFLLDRRVRNIICQRRSAIDFDRLLNDGKILLANLSTGLLTEKISGTLGSFLVTKIVNAAFRRAAVPENKRRPWYLYVDEFQSFMNLSVGFERILAESRKYKLVLAGLANQYIGQLSPGVRQAIFGNVGNLIVFRLGVEDAHAAAKELGVFTADDVLNLEVGQAIARLGVASTAFNLQTYRESDASPRDLSGQVIDLARRRYAKPRKEVEREISLAVKAAEQLEQAASWSEELSDPDEEDLIV